MSRIHLLPEQIYNKIAAGEVVERPASVLKELLENALDAGAKKISVQIRKAGSEFISVVDDGCGMDADDALLCFEPHATSKILKESDLFAITTMGFRGEAMPSIASVSKITLRTRPKELQEGCEVVLHGGKMIASSPVGCAPGTEVIVRDLFFNTPARKKFLRSRPTEEHHIAEMMTNLALAHADIAFELKLDNRVFLSSPVAADLIPRIRELFGREYADAMLPMAHEENGIRITGFIARRSFTRPTRLEQRIFVNGRPVEAQGIYRGIRDGCGPVLDRGRYQPCILFLALDPSLVDVNVHPSKREVRFSREFEVVAAVHNAVTEAMRNTNSPIISMGSVSVFQTEAPLGDETDVSPKPFENIPEPPSPAAGPGQEEDFSMLDAVMRSAFLDYSPQSGAISRMATAADLPGLRTDHADESRKDRTGMPSAEEKQGGPAAAPQEKNSLGLRIVGILNNTYILAERADGLILIDQHAAHERILFEKLLKGVNGILSQRLLIPVPLELSRAEIAFLEKNAGHLEKLGFEAEPFGSNSVKLNAIPAALSQDNAGNAFKDMLSEVAENGTPGQRIDYEKFAMCACKAAVKANDILSIDEAVSLLRQLSFCELPFACPHGRPTILNISMKEIERRFGRK